MSDTDSFEAKKTWHELYVELLANPMDNRTDKKFCEEIGIDPTTLQKWKQKNRISIFGEVQRRRKAYINELRAVTYKALANKLDKDTNAIKLSLQITGDLVERSESKVEYMDEDAKKRRINALIEEIGKRKKAQSEAESGSRPEVDSNGVGRTEPGTAN